MFKEEIDPEQIAVPFIQFRPSDGFEIHPEAIKFLQKLDSPISVIAVCGKYRTGKSYLLNKLFLDHPEETKAPPKRTSSVGFEVGPTINPCTKGVWLWRSVFEADHPELGRVKAVVIDTEGLGAFDEDENHDSKIFLLALLLSSLLVYNSVGAIDENALNLLSLVINLSKNLQIKSKQGGEVDPDELANYFPTFLWVLRDFSLKLQDAEGNKISFKQYLENALKEQKGNSEAIEKKNRVRRLLRHFFKDRDCSTLVRPTEDESNLQILGMLKDDALRPEFVEQLQLLKTKIHKKVKPKFLNGNVLSGQMLIELA